MLRRHVCPSCIFLGHAFGMRSSRPFRRPNFRWHDMPSAGDMRFAQASLWNRVCSTRLFFSWSLVTRANTLGLLKSCAIRRSQTSSTENPTHDQ